MVVLQELAERDEDLPEVCDHADVSCDPLRARRVREFDEIPRVENDQRPLDVFAGGDGSRLARAFRLDLRPHGDEIVEDMHRGRMQRQCGEPGGTRSAVSKAETTRSARMAEDGPARDDVLN